MNFRKLLLILTLCIVAMGAAEARAQGPGGDENEPSTPDQGSLGGDPPRRDRGRGPGGPSGNDDRGSGRGSERGDDRGGRRSGSGGRRGDGAGAPPNGAPGKPNTKSKVRVGRVGPKASLPPTVLPAAYTSKDLDKDGQIGMYEWSKTDLSTFRRLDTNGDGFLVPAELINPGSGGSTATVSSASSSGSSSATVAKSVSQPSEPAADLKTISARGAFDYLDKDKDGKLTQEEWDRGRAAKKLFTEGKVEVQFPFPRDKFVENYVKLSP